MPRRPCLLALALLVPAAGGSTPTATPRFLGMAYKAVNDNATHNIQLLAMVDANSFVGHWSVHHEGTGVNRTAIKSWVVRSAPTNGKKALLGFCDC